MHDGLECSRAPVASGFVPDTLPGQLLVQWVDDADGQNAPHGKDEEHEERAPSKSLEGAHQAPHHVGQLGDVHHHSDGVRHPDQPYATEDQEEGADGAAHKESDKVQDQHGQVDEVHRLLVEFKALDEESPGKLQEVDAEDEVITDVHPGRYLGRALGIVVRLHGGDGHVEDDGDRQDEDQSVGAVEPHQLRAQRAVGAGVRRRGGPLPLVEHAAGLMSVKLAVNARSCPCR
mmetsp:Transcript_29081/g.83354  ORF Transcript_29081/g.83354 Transcript_29081/m.83354 type:complete len:232 (-) Transcript_29081:52-747(-)